MSNNITDFEPEQLYTLTSVAQIKAYVHSTRIMLLSMLSNGKRTISSIARENGVHPANLTHHFRLLEKAGLIRLVEKRDTGKNLEKYYRAVAYNFVINLDAESSKTVINKKALGLEILRDNLSAAIRTVSKDDDDDVVAVLGVSRLTVQDAERLEKKVYEFIDEFRRCDSPLGKPFTLNLSAYPAEFFNVTITREEKIQL
ncbi:MAG TPA: helix-turn-helix domain-containing protein [Dehalococcoidales bacterium]|nr:helix-turn-helix domain-containing protein [Dehalococcoidales bacterium]